MPNGKLTFFNTVYNIQIPNPFPTINNLMTIGKSYNQIADPLKATLNIK